MATENLATTDLPAIPAKRYFTIGEVSDLCAVKPHVLRYWEQEFTQLKPVKRRGNRRGQTIGHTTPWRKAIVTLAPGQKIEFFEGV